MMEQIEDAELWARASAGSSEAFASLFDRHANAVYRFCFGRTADWALAEDLTSVVFLETWRRRAEVELPEGKLLPWLLGVAVNALRNHRRSLRRYRAALTHIPPLEPERDFVDDLSDRLEAQDQISDLLAEVDRLPRLEQETLALSAAGLAPAEIAVALGVEAGTVRARLFRARRRLRSREAVSLEANRGPSSEGVNTR